MIHWFTREWWKFLLERPLSWRAFWCRVRGHADWLGRYYGVEWYNAGGMEPDMSCKNCGDDLG